MASQTKMQEIESDVYYLVMKNKRNGLDLIKCSFYLKIILKTIDR